ncbi:MAG: TonB family protein [Gammaproteobacteria bacterium]|nr:TonB family protein [Gammaproteobacteria bacterium]
MTLPPGDAPVPAALSAAPLLALTQDAQLLDALRRVSDPAHEVCAAGSEVDFSTQLLKHHAGVALIDSAAIASPVAQLTHRLVTQFPDLVLIVSGGIEEQNALSAQIADGSVHRFLHKPVSEQRVRLFVEAAWRRHAEVRALPARRPRSSPASTPRAWSLWWGLALAFAVLAVPLAWIATNPTRPRHSHGAPMPAPAPAEHARADAELESLLRRADQALSAGSLTTPAGANAADLYREALRRNARDPRALKVIERVVGRLLGSADAQLRQGHLDAAQELAEQARAIDPQHAGVAFLLGQIGTAREHAVLEKAQRAAARGNVAGALAVLDEAAHSEHRPALVDEARETLARQELNSRVTDYLGHARDALRRAKLIAPAGDNAHFYIESARTLAPQDARVAEALRDLVARLESEARQALAVGDPDGADSWITAASETGADAAQTTELHRQAQELRAASSAQARAAAADALEVHIQTPASPPRPSAAATYVNEDTLVRTRYVSPKFPDEARRRGLEGWVELHFVVGVDGTVGALEVVGAQPAGLFEKAALDAVGRWRYRPVQHDGQPVSQRAQLRLRFRLQ